jgi:hypothetical protein
MIPPELVGLNFASTFTGFCSNHDGQLFSPVENKIFVTQQEQCFLLGYRAIARELYTKNGQESLGELRRDADNGKPIEQQVEIQTFNAMHDIGISAGMQALQHHKNFGTT